ncbi:WecB/TagA/CpsF family glycosyltransferase [Phocaeicola sp. KGMB11183]|uniref:WecB/TagA/CpsF family glycosyltransferase n=1 Tax=Phocaeicola acetigenes TaxID=3016083 RepID=A0ABT4PK37_9BACT|nr:WecB/TagA/CpsF family glycosyltransferase [Phocaeicola sp. KGMB11183]MCZ8373416.1 WecB/TagA/CpsF family glycosyltransferase [Phocaeicola sp. KGMB11183]
MSPLVENIIATEKKTIDSIFSCKGKIYTFLNPVSYLIALDNKNLFKNFDGIFADGSILAAAIKILYGENITRRSFDMTSLAPKLLSYTEKEKKTIYIIASQQEQVEKAVKIFKERYPNIIFSGYRNGYFNSEKDMDIEAEKITQINPDFLIVGMGALMQENFLLKVKEHGFKGIGFTCGGFIHQTSKNEIEYYPKWADKLNLRFIYRMYKEKHTRKRYIQAALLFPTKFICEKFFG